MNAAEETDSNDELVLHEGIETIYKLIHEGEILESPIDIHVPKTVAIKLPKLTWHHLDLEAKRVKITNSGHTVIYSAKWQQERPYISGGPFIGNYVFSQLHFHWGSTNLNGSEHTISGAAQVLEMHVVCFKSCYLTQESALKRKDGIAVAAYMYRLQESKNEAMQIIVDALEHIRDPHTSVRLKNFALLKFVPAFTDDYFMYVGSVNTTTCVHYVVWLISRRPLGISTEQIDVFRSLVGADGQLLVQNCRNIQPLGGRTLYHVNPSEQLHSTLLGMATEDELKQPILTNNSNDYANPKMSANQL